MAKYVKEVEAVQFKDKKDGKGFVEVFIAGTSYILRDTDYAIYENGQVVAVKTKEAFEAEYKPAKSSK